MGRPWQSVNLSMEFSIVQHSENPFTAYASQVSGWVSMYVVENVPASRGIQFKQLQGAQHNLGYITQPQYSLLSIWLFAFDQR